MGIGLTDVTESQYQYVFLDTSVWKPGIPHQSYPFAKGDIVVANTHAKRVLSNNPLPRIGQFLGGLSLTLPDLIRVYQVQNSVVRSIGKDNIRSLLARWEPHLPVPQKGKWMTDRDMRRGVKLALLLELDKWPHQRILDIGCGTGFFLHVCKKFGHAVLGLDLPNQRMFKEWTSFLGVLGVGFRIRPFTPLPSLGRKFDLVTMDSLTFDKEWSEKEWRFFLNDLRGHLTTNGRVYAMLKFSGKTRSLSNKEISRIFSDIAGFSTKFLTGRQLLLTRMDLVAAEQRTRVKRAV